MKTIKTIKLTLAALALFGFTQQTNAAIEGALSTEFQQAITQAAEQFTTSAASFIAKAATSPVTFALLLQNKDRIIHQLDKVIRFIALKNDKTLHCLKGKAFLNNTYGAITTVLASELGKNLYSGVKETSPTFLSRPHLLTISCTTIGALLTYKLEQRSRFNNRQGAGQAFYRYGLLTGITMLKYFRDSALEEIAHTMSPKEPSLMVDPLHAMHFLYGCACFKSLERVHEKLINLEIQNLREETPLAIEQLPAITNPETNEAICHLCHGDLVDEDEECIEIPKQCDCLATKYIHRNCLLLQIANLRENQIFNCSVCRGPVTFPEAEKSLSRRATQAALALLS